MPKNLTKSDLVASLAKELQIPEDTAKASLKHLVEMIVENLTAYGEISISGFGTPITIRQKSKSSIAIVDQPNMESSAGVDPALDQRKLKRRNFILDIEVFDRNSKKSLGDLGDITTEGLMVVSEDAISENKEFQIKVRLPEEAEKALEIDFDASSIRCQKTIHESIYVTGFKITSLNEDNKEKIEFLINEYAV